MCVNSIRVESVLAAAKRALLEAGHAKEQALKP
jgi:hypothetical protein